MGKIKERIIDFALLIVAGILAIQASEIYVDHTIYIIAFIIYWIFSSLYYHFSLTSRKGHVTVDYGISYSTSFAIFVGPFGALLFEIILRFTIYSYKKYTNKADQEEWLDTLFNIGSFTVTGAIAYYLYHSFIPIFSSFLFGYWVLYLIIIIIVSVISSSFLMLIFLINGQIHSWKDLYTLFTDDRDSLDVWKVTISNGLLFIFLQHHQWDQIIVLFLLNYIISRSIYSKSQSIQHKQERDHFEKMAYTDFLTGIPNRAAMNKEMEKLDQSSEQLALIVSDIDHFKRINDSYNHDVGDQVIQQFSNLLTTTLQDKASVFRTGGEEFTMFLREFDYQSSVMKIEHLQHQIANEPLLTDFQNQEIEIHYTASFGLYYFSPANVSMEKGYIRADTLLLEAKQQGRNKLISDFHSPTM